MQIYLRNSVRSLFFLSPLQLQSTIYFIIGQRSLLIVEELFILSEYIYIYKTHTENPSLYLKGDYCRPLIKYLNLVVIVSHVCLVPESLWSL